MIINKKIRLFYKLCLFFAREMNFDKESLTVCDEFKSLSRGKSRVISTRFRHGVRHEPGHHETSTNRKTD